MEFDWAYFQPAGASTDEVSESFEDPFSLRFLPDSPRFSLQNRFFNLGRTNGGKAIFAIYSSTGKIVRVVTARPATAEENYFYDRKSAQFA